MTEICSFLPIAGSRPVSLILGSMPGNESIKQNQYYAHPRNSFWTIICNLLGSSAEKRDYEQRCALIENNHIALWDVLKSCRRAGSLDSAIENSSIIVNDFNSLFESHPAIRTIFFNGARAEQEYRKRVLPYLKVEFGNKRLIRLPSTSPAMAQMSIEEKTAKWSMITKLSL